MKLIVLLLCLFFAYPADAAILPGTSQHSTFAGGTTATASYTVGGGANLLVVKVLYFDGENKLTGVTFNSVAMTFQVSDDNDGFPGIHERVAIYTLVAPSTGGAFNVVANFSPSNCCGGDLIIESWSGVDQTMPVGHKAGKYRDTGVTSPWTTAVTIGANNVTTDGIHRNNTPAMTPGSGQTVIFEGADVGTSERIGASYKTGTGADMTWTWTGTPTRAATATIEMIAASALPDKSLGRMLK